MREAANELNNKLKVFDRIRGARFNRILVFSLFRVQLQRKTVPVLFSRLQLYRNKAE